METRTNKRILGIETSCDETALSLIEASGALTSPEFKILNTALYSQIETHKPFGGVYPSLAKREHAKNLVPLLKSLLDKEPKNVPEISTEKWNQVEKILHREPELFEALKESAAQIPRPDIDFIAVTAGPGLEPALWVGINFARALSLIWDIPALPVNHMEGHIISALKEKTDIKFPAVSLLISGGHTEIVLVKNWSEYEVIGNTKDDAVGEAFDKVARILGLPYPGGPEISRLANLAREKKYPENSKIKLPRPMLNSGDYDFSFSGLKTAVLYLVQKLKKENLFDDQVAEQIALEFEEAVTEVLFKKTKSAIVEYGATFLIIGGGVIANKYIRETFQNLEGVTVLVPEIKLATDNAVMIAMAGYLKHFSVQPEINPEIKADGNLAL